MGILENLSIMYEDEPAPISLFSEAPYNTAPIYVILTSGTSIVSKAIMSVTKSKYSHATIAVNYYETVSMGTTAKNFGIAVESILEFPDRHRNGDMKICRRFIPLPIYTKMVERIELFKKNWKKIDYSFGKMRNFFSFVPSRKVRNYKDETSFICSEFVAMVLKEIEDFSDKIKNKGHDGKYVLSPKEIESFIGETFEVIYEGGIRDMKSDFLYKIDKPYIKLKENILSNVIKNIENIQHFSESESNVRFSSPTSYEERKKIVWASERTSLERFIRF